MSANPKNANVIPPTYVRLKYTIKYFHCLLFHSFTKSRDSVEKVVKDPKKPTPIKRNSEFPSLLPAAIPNRKAPIKLTTIVPKGNECCSLNTLLIANRAIAPKNPPIPTNKLWINMFVPPFKYL